MSETRASSSERCAAVARSHEGARASIRRLQRLLGVTEGALLGVTIFALLGVTIFALLGVTVFALLGVTEVALIGATAIATAML